MSQTLLEIVEQLVLIIESVERSGTSASLSRHKTLLTCAASTLDIALDCINTYLADLADLNSEASEEN